MTRSVEPAGKTGRSGRGLLTTIVVVVALAAAVGGWFTFRSLAQSHPNEVSIETSTGTHRITVEWAATTEERTQGLMNRAEMAADHGMMFDFQVEQPVSFWMKNTILSLDMIFIHADGTVYRVETNTEPFSERAIPAGAAVRYVLEVNAGTSQRIGLRPGDHVRLN